MDGHDDGAKLGATEGASEIFNGFPGRRLDVSPPLGSTRDSVTTTTTTTTKELAAATAKEKNEDPCAGGAFKAGVDRTADAPETCVAAFCAACTAIFWRTLDALRVEEKRTSVRYEITRQVSLCAKSSPNSENLLGWRRWLLRR